MEENLESNTANTTINHNPQLMEKDQNYSKSFAEVVGNQKSTFIPLKEVTVHKGEAAIRFSMEEVKKLAEPYKYTLVGKFSHGQPKLELIRKFLNTLGLKATYTVGVIDNKHILIRCYHEDDFLRLWLRKSWNIYSFPMRVFKWSYDFMPGTEPSVTNIWIGLHMLPIHLYNKSSIFSIASAFGTPLKLDSATASQTRPNLARICIEVDLKKELTNRVWIGYGEEDKDEGFWQYCEYEQVPEFCLGCKKIGHNKNECKIGIDKNEEEKQDNRKEKMNKEQDLNKNNWKKDQKEGQRKGVTKEKGVQHEEPDKNQKNSTQWVEKMGTNIASSSKEVEKNGVEEEIISGKEEKKAPEKKTNGKESSNLIQQEDGEILQNISKNSSMQNVTKEKVQQKEKPKEQEVNQVKDLVIYNNTEDSHNKRSIDAKENEGNLPEQDRVDFMENNSPQVQNNLITNEVMLEENGLYVDLNLTPTTVSNSSIQL